MFITFLTDFGLQDDFVGTCHGVIKRIAPDAQIIDITHGIPPQAVLQGALVLANTLPYMPVGVHLAVVDPGVGGHRRAARAPRRARAGFYVGPDNGLLLPAAERAGISRGPRARQSRLRARVGLAHVPRPRSLRARGGPPRPRRRRSASSARRSIPEALVRLELPEPSFGEGVVHATTLYVDSFGNIALNLTRDDLDRVGVVPGTPGRARALGRALLRRRGAHVRRRTRGRRDPLRGQLPEHVDRDLERERGRDAARRDRQAAQHPARLDLASRNPAPGALGSRALRGVGGAGLRPRRLSLVSSCAENRPASRASYRRGRDGAGYRLTHDQRRHARRESRSSGPRSEEAIVSAESLTVVDNRTGVEYTLPIVDGAIRATDLAPDQGRRRRRA